MLAAVGLLCSLAVPAPATAAEPASAPINTEAPKLSGTAVVGHSLSCTSGVWKNNPSSFIYVWLRDGIPIPGQAASSYTVQSADWGHSLTCRVTAANAAGEYTVGALPTGAYSLDFYSGSEFSSGPYLFQIFNEKSLFSEADHVAVTAPVTTGPINAMLHRGGEITGTVTNGLSSAPVANVAVCPLEAGKPFELESFYFEGCAYSNSKGEYAVIGLKTGTYKLLLLPEKEEGLPEYVPQFYNVKSSFEEADSVSATEGSATTGVNAVLLPAPLGGAISGHVASSAAGKASLAGITVCAGSSLGYIFGECALTDASGNYTITGLLTGSYKVSFWAGSGAGSYVYQYYNGKATEEEATPVSVKTLETKSGVNAELVPAGGISGVVTDASSHAPVASQEVCADAVGPPSYGECAVTDAAGNYAIDDLLTGNYKVIFEQGYQESNVYVAQYYNDKLSVGEANEVHVSSPSTTAGINAEMRVGGQIVGTVIDAATHAPLVHIRVCAIDPKKFGTCALTDASGGYVIKRLLTNTYKVRFSASKEGGNYLPQYYSGKPALAEAGGVSVALGSTTAGINAEMHPGGQIHGLTLDAVTHAPVGGISICAEKVEGESASNCSFSNELPGSGAAVSNLLAVPTPNSSFSQVKKPVFAAKAGQLDFFFKIANAGTMSWSLFFKNADVGFADSLGFSFTENSDAASAKRRPRGCRKGFVKRRGKCARVLVPFSSGSEPVSAGTVEIKVPVGAKALKALRVGRTLHVSGTFKFQSSLGGASVSHTFSTVVRPPKKAKHRHHK